jgi:hypothetical protein
MMKIIKAFPPNWNELAKHFPIKGKRGIVYAYGDTLYNPSGIIIPPWIIKHEYVHMERQQDEGMNPVNWWDEYIQYLDFRLKEEILAHQAEWQAYSGPYRDHYLGSMAERLSGPLYDYMIDYNSAVKEITHV